MAERILAIACSYQNGIFHVAGREVISRYQLAQRIALENGFSTEKVFPRLRSEDKWAAIRPKDLSLKTLRKD